MNKLTKTQPSSISIPILALLFFVVFTYLPITYYYFPFFGKIKIVLLSSIVLLASYALTSARYTNRTALSDPIFLCWVVILPLIAIGIFNSCDRGLTLATLKANLKYLIILIVMIKIVDTKNRLDLVIKVFTACAVLMATSTIYNYTFHRALLSGGYRGVALQAGIFADPNDLALFFNTLLPFTLYFLLSNRKKLLPFIGCITLIAGTILTFSRGGFLGLCVTGLAFTIFFARKEKKYLLPIIIGLVIIFLVVPDSYLERIATITSWEIDETTQLTGTRLDAWRVVLLEGLKRPFLGVGAGCSYYVAGRALNDWHALHNSFIQIFVDTGLFSFIAYCLIFIFPFRSHKRTAERDIPNSYKTLSKIILISLSSYAATAFFLPQAYSVLLYTLSAICIIQNQLVSKSQSDKAFASEIA